MNQPLSIVLLVDNETPEGLIAEHGFAAWIESGDECFLFDTGQGAALEHNARTLGVDLGTAAALILSHGHYDHTGGIPTFLAANRQAPILYGKGATQAIADQVSSLGSNLLIVRPGQRLGPGATSGAPVSAWAAWLPVIPVTET